MKKINSLKKTGLILLSLFVFSAVSVSAQNYAVYDDQNGDGSQTTEEGEIQEPAAPEKTREEIAAEKAAAKAAKLEAKEKAKERNDEYLGITYKPVKNYCLKDGNIRIDFKASTGSFNLYVKNEKEKYVPLIAKYDGAKSTAFFTKLNGVDYQLNQNAAFNKTLRQISDNEIQLVYTMAKKVQVAVDFTTVNSKADVPADMVKITVYTTNISEKESRVAVKAVIDTVLGEASENHFLTTADTKINGAKQFSSMKKERTVISTDGITSIQLVLDGNTVTSPEFVSFGTKDNLLKGAWVPVTTDGRNFNSINAYNNSAVAVNWPETKLKAGETKTVTFYAATGIERQMPNGIAFVDPEEKGNADSNVRASEYPELEYSVPEVTEAQLDPAYVQDLINKINALKSDPDTVNRKEVRELNAELDAILSKLRKQL